VSLLEDNAAACADLKADDLVVHTLFQQLSPEPQPDRKRLLFRVYIATVVLMLESNLDAHPNLALLFQVRHPNTAS
jgi:hypothetical protein